MQAGTSAVSQTVNRGQQVRAATYMFR